MLTTLQTIPSHAPITYKFVLQQGNPAPIQFTSPTSSQNFLLCGIPANYAVVGVKVQSTIQFVGAGISSLTCQIGTATHPAVYAPAFECTQVVTPLSFALTGALAEDTTDPHDIIARFVSNGPALSGITIGQLEITIQVQPM